MTDRSNEQSARLAVIGMGYVGLPLAVVFAEAGVPVVGIDLSARKMELLNEGTSYIEDIPTSRLAPLVEQGLIRGTTDFDALRGVEAISICVPTPLSKTRDPDISIIVSALDEIAPRLQPGQVIVLESTTYPGTTREVIQPAVEAGGHSVGKDIFLAFSPERVDPGRDDYTTKNTPKVLGGLTEACTRKAADFYGQAIDTLVEVSSPEAAEMVKLLENTFRAVNIGLANEVLLMCDKLNLDVWEVIDAASTKPFGFMRFMPGPGLGGHCIPIDPLYLSWKLKTFNYTARFIELASEINTAMPRYWVRKVQEALNDDAKALRGSRVLVLGVAYKKNVSDVRESPAIDIISLLAEGGADVRYHDPHVEHLDEDGIDMHSVNDLDQEVRAADCIVIVTDHSAYDWAQITPAAKKVVDTRGVA